MRKLSLVEWAEVGEVIAAVAVVISLLLVVYSLDKNTEALQGGSDDMLFESHREIAGLMVSDPSLVEIRLKVRRDEALSEPEAIRWKTYEGLFLDVWAMAYMRFNEDLLSERHWQAWDTYFTDHFRNSDMRLNEERWQELVPGFDAGFWGHVRGAVIGEGEPKNR